jgi:hypothetical protein
MKLRMSILISLVLTLAAPAFAQDASTAEPQLSYFVCDWGLLTIEQPTEPPAIYIEIDSPANFSAVEGTSFTVSGTGAGLFEGNIVVEATANGEVVFSQPTTLQSEEVGGMGAWSIDIDLGELEGATPVFISAYSESPEDGTTIAADNIDLNVNSEFGLPFVDITTPTYRAGVSTIPLLIEGNAGGAFENNIVIEVRDSATDAILAETFATVSTDDIGGSGPFSAEVTVDAEPGTAIVIRAYQPPVEDGAEITVVDSEVAVVSPLAQTYDRFLIVRSGDPIISSEQVCTAGAAEFDNTNINPLVINSVQVLSTRSMLPLVNVSIEAAGSSNCPSPLRTRTVRDGDTLNIEIYYDTTQPAACTADLSPITQRVSLGTLPNPDYTITVNGEPVE